MSRWFHVWWLFIIALIVGTIIVLYGIANTRQQLSANNLYDAVRYSASYARDNSQRMSRGAFIINKTAFRKRLSSYNIKNIGEMNTNKLGKGKQNRMYIHYLIDNNQTNDRTGNHVRNGYLDGAEYKDYCSSHKYIPVRAIQVQVIPVSRDDPYKAKVYKDRHGKKRIKYYDYKSDTRVIDEDDHYSNMNLSRITNVNNKYVATLVIQGQKGVTKGHYISDRDMKDLAKNSSDDSNYAPNDPLRHPNRTRRTEVDLTDPQYSNENGYSKSLDASDGY